MVAPIYDPKLLFTSVQTYIERECIFCPNKIDPSVHMSHFRVTIPEKTIMHAHEDCFEQLAWSMLRYLVRHLNEEKMELVN